MTKLMKTRRFIATGVMTAFMFVGIASTNAQDLTLSAEDMLYDAQGASITLDGDASDWVDRELTSSIPFA